MFEHTPATKERSALTLFVTYASGSGREIVSHYGTCAKKGTWTCRKHGSKGCAHMSAARKHGALEVVFADVKQAETEETDEDELSAAELQRRRGKLVLSNTDMYR